MNNNINLSDIEIILSAQQDVIRKLQQNLNQTKEEFDQAQQKIDAISAMLEQIEENADSLTPQDFEHQIKHDNNKSSTIDDLLKYYASLSVDNWQEYVIANYYYCRKNNIEPFAAYEALLTEDDLKELDKFRKVEHLAWEKWDYIIVGIAASVAVLSDLLIVKTPASSAATRFLKANLRVDKSDKGWFANKIHYLEQKAKVPYDNSTELRGMSGKTHRLQTLGHDPVLGLIFGTLDIMFGTMTGFEYADNVHKLVVRKMTDEQTINIIEAILKQLAHLLSDAFTAQGLQPPFFSLLQLINVPSGHQSKTVAEIARYMYTQGYDLRNFFVMGISPAFIEIIVRGYFGLTLYHQKTEKTQAHNLKLKTMLLAAHSIAAAINSGKVIIMSNPLAINYTQWLALVRYLVPVVRYTIFDKIDFTLEKLENLSEQNWSEILTQSENLLSAAYCLDGKNFVLE